jgi:hypothetical protein
MEMVRQKLIKKNIESVNVLKGSSICFIWFSRQSCAFVITTKSGKRSKGLGVSNSL